MTKQNSYAVDFAVVPNTDYINQIFLAYANLVILYIVCTVLFKVPNFSFKLA